MLVAEESHTPPVIIGRADERRLIEEVIGRAATEEGVALLISGETGIGKTALAQHALTRAGQRGFGTFSGGSNPLNQELAYGPFVEALGSGLRALEPPERARLIDDLPALGKLIVGLSLPSPEPMSDPRLEKTRLFEAVLRLLDRMSRRAPVALLLDDLQWFDRASMELLAYLTRDLSSFPVLLIGTVRSEDRDDDRTRQLVHTMRRMNLTEEIELPSLTKDEIADLATRALGSTVSDELVEWLTTKSGGIPLFADALLTTLRNDGSLVESGGAWRTAPEDATTTPRVVRDVVRERLGRLSEAERSALDLIAVSGGRLTHGALVELGEPRATSYAADLVAAGLLTEITDPELSYEFAHPLMLQVVYDDIPLADRRRQHARFASLWERIEPDDVDRLAFHYRGALPGVDVKRAAEVSVAAGRSALARYANSEAIDHFDAALQLADLGPDRTEVLLLAGEARLMVGDIAGAVATWREALARTDGEGQMAARIHLLIARGLSEAFLESSEPHVQAGLAALEDSAIGDDHVELLYRSVINAHRHGEADRIDEAARRVSVAANQADTERARAMATVAQLVATMDHSRYDEAEEILATSPSLTRGDPEMEMRGYMFLSEIAAARGDIPALREANGQGRRLVERAGLTTAGVRIQFGFFVETVLEGDWDRAGEIAAETRMMAEKLDHEPTITLADLLMVILHAYRGEFDEAENLVRSFHAQLDEGGKPGVYMAHPMFGAALLALERGDPEEALHEIDRVQTPWVSSILPPWRSAVRAEALAQLGRVDEAMRAADDLTELCGEGWYPSATAHRVRGLVFRFLEQDESGIDELRQAVAGFAELGMPFEEARAGIEMAELALAGGDQNQDLATAVEDWYRVATRLGARPYADRARRLLHAMGSPVNVETPATPLTPRQLEVTELVAEGLSNAEIAELLFISPRTVESHLDHIYTKLGINSRVALATYLTSVQESPPT